MDQELSQAPSFNVYRTMVELLVSHLADKSTEACPLPQSSKAEPSLGHRTWRPKCLTPGQDASQPASSCGHTINRN